MRSTADGAVTPENEECLSAARAPSSATTRERTQMQIAIAGIAFASRPRMTRVTQAIADGYATSVEHARRNQHVRVLRWTFRRDEDEPAVVCELALTGEDRAYELRVPAEWHPIGVAIERFDDALSAFQRHAMIERTLIDDGWALDTFESEKVTVH